AAAAKSTSDLIQGTLSVVSAGTSLVQGTNAAFHEVASCAKKVTDLVGDIAAASSEQTHGIAEVSAALMQGSEVTQTNSVNARKIEELTGNLSAQVNVMDHAVHGIRGMVTRAHTRPPSSHRRGSGVL